MDNAIKAVEEKGYELVFLPNSVHSSYMSFNRKHVEIGIETQIKTHFDIAVIALAHEAGHVLDETLFENSKVFRERKAWKTAFEEFLPEQPILKLEIQKWANLQLLGYILPEIYGVSFTETEFNEQLQKEG